MEGRHHFQSKLVVNNTTLRRMITSWLLILALAVANSFAWKLTPIDIDDFPCKPENLKVWLRPLILFPQISVLLKNLPLLSLSLSYRHKSVTFVTRRALFHAWQDGKRNPSTRTPIFLVRCQYVIHLAPMGNVDCQIWAHVRLDGEIF